MLKDFSPAHRGEKKLRSKWRGPMRIIKAMATTLVVIPWTETMDDIGELGLPAAKFQKRAKGAAGNRPLHYELVSTKNCKPYRGPVGQCLDYDPLFLHELNNDWELQTTRTFVESEADFRSENSDHGNDPNYQPPSDEDESISSNDSADNSSDEDNDHQPPEVDSEAESSDEEAEAEAPEGPIDPPEAPEGPIGPPLAEDEEEEEEDYDDPPPKIENRHQPAAPEANIPHPNYPPEIPPPPPNLMGDAMNDSNFEFQDDEEQDDYEEQRDFDVPLLTTPIRATDPRHLPSDPNRSPPGTEQESTPKTGATPKIKLHTPVRLPDEPPTYKKTHKYRKLVDEGKSPKVRKEPDWVIGGKQKVDSPHQHPEKVSDCAKLNAN
jgi:hypothetical protein